MSKDYLLFKTKANRKADSLTIIDYKKPNAVKDNIVKLNLDDLLKYRVELALKENILTETKNKNIEYLSESELSSILLIKSIKNVENDQLKLKKDSVIKVSDFTENELNELIEIEKFVDDLIGKRETTLSNINVESLGYYIKVEHLLRIGIENELNDTLCSNLNQKVIGCLLIWENDAIIKWEKDNLSSSVKKLEQEKIIKTNMERISSLRKELIKENTRLGQLKSISNNKMASTAFVDTIVRREDSIIYIKEKIRKLFHEICKIELERIRCGIGSNNNYLDTIISKFVIKYDALNDNNYDIYALPANNTSSKKSILGLGSAVNFDVIIGGLVNFVAKRFKEELANQLFDKLKNTLNKDTITEIAVLKTMLPRTHHFLVTIDEYNLPKLYNELKQNIEYDLNHLSEQIYNLKDIPEINKEITNDYQSELAFEGFWLYKQMLDMNNPVDLVSKIETMPVCQKWDNQRKSCDTGTIEYNIANTIKLISLLSNSLTVTNGESRVWVDAEEFKRNIKNENFYYLYFGLLLQQDKNYFDVTFKNKNESIVFSNSINKQFATYNSTLKPKFEKVLFDFVDAAENVNNEVALVSKLKKQNLPVSSDTIYNLLTASINVIEKASSLSDSLISLIKPDKEYNHKPISEFVGYARTGTEVFKELSDENYISAFMLILEKLNETLNKEKVINSQDIQLLKEEITNEQTLFYSFYKPDNYDKKKDKNIASILIMMDQLTTAITKSDPIYNSSNLSLTNSIQNDLIEIQNAVAKLKLSNADLQKWFLCINKINGYLSTNAITDNTLRQVSSYNFNNYKNLYLIKTLDSLNKIINEFKRKPNLPHLKRILVKKELIDIADIISLLKNTNEKMLFHKGRISTTMLKINKIENRLTLLNIDNLSGFRFTTFDDWKGNLKLTEESNLKFISSKTHEILNFVLGLATAKTDDEAAKVIEKAAVPAGGYSIKNKSRFTISLNSYAGFYGAIEQRYYKVIDTANQNIIKDSSAWGKAWGFSAPVGFSFNWGMGKKKEWNLGIHISLIDIGALVNFRVSDSSELPKFDYRNIFAPGAHFVISPIKNNPVTFGVGIQKGPNLISYKKDLDNFYHGWRVNAFVVVDIPIFYLYKKTRFLNQ